MATRVLEYVDEDYNVHLTLQGASVRQGMKRTQLARAQTIALRLEEPVAGKEEKEEAKSEVALDERIIRIFTYPACLGCLVKVDNVADKDGRTPTKLLPDEPTLEEFFDLPDTLVNEWEGLAYTLNPHWAPRFREPDEEGKPGETKEDEDAKKGEKGSTASSSTPS